MSNRDTVNAIYEAFGRGDIPAILSKVADDVEWERGGVDHGVPWLAPGRGKAHAMRFFESLAGVEITKFVPMNLLEGGNQIVAVIDIEATVRATGVSIADEELHLWTFNDEGKVSAFHHVLDTAQHVNAVRGVAVAQ